MTERVMGDVVELAVPWVASDNQETCQRAFRSETLECNGRSLELLSLEADHISDVRITPPDWHERVSQAITNADVTFVEYFLPELEENIPFLHRLGSLSENIIKVYGEVADIAQGQGKDVAVADIGNKLLYEAYHLGMFPALGWAALASARLRTPLGVAGFVAGEACVAGLAYQAARGKGVYGVQPTRSERYMINATDARRVLTARGIAQTAEEYPLGSSFLYIAAPAHTARVKAMLERAPTATDSAKAVLYKGFAGLDRSTRIYSPSDEGWELQSATPIR